MGEDRKKYNKLENELQRINKNFITLNDDEKKKYNPVLKYVVDDIIKKMQGESPLFKNLYESVYYGGSFYDNLKVGKPEEYDIDLKMVIPKLLEPKIEVSNEPGFVKITLLGWESFEKNKIEYAKFGDLKNFCKDNYLLQDKILSWMEGTVVKALNKDKISDNMYQIIYPDNKKIKIKMTKGGPAMTLNISCEELNIAMDVDLVASFKFTETHWPTSPFKSVPPQCAKKEFLIVPKSPKGEVNDIKARLWRLSFQEQERELMNGKDRFKPALRLMKKLRDTQEQGKISSYFLKTIFLNEAASKDKDFWCAPLSFVFMHMLKVYQECIENKKIPYYWYGKNNLLKGIEPKTLDNYKFKLKKIIDTIEKKFDSQPEIIAECILANVPEYDYNSTESNDQTWSERRMKKALKSVLQKSLDYEQASKKYNIPTDLLQNRVQKVHNGILVKEACKKELNVDNILKKYINSWTRDSMKKAIRAVSKNLMNYESASSFFAVPVDLLEVRVIQFQNGMSLKEASKKYLNISISSKHGLVKFYTNLTELNKKVPEIWILLDTGIVTGHGVWFCKPGKIKERLNDCTTLYTANICLNNSGKSMPTTLIFPSTQINNDHSNVTIKHEPSGTLTPNLFINWLSDFIQQTKPSKDNPVLLLINNISDINSDLAIEFASKNHVTLLEYPKGLRNKFSDFLNRMRNVYISQNKSVLKTPSWCDKSTECFVKTCQIFLTEDRIRKCFEDSRINGRINL